MSPFALVFTRLGTVVVAIWGEFSHQSSCNVDLERLGRTVAAFLKVGSAVIAPSSSRPAHLQLGKLHVAALSNEVIAMCVCGLTPIVAPCAEIRMRQALHIVMGVCGEALHTEVDREERHVAGYGVKDVQGIAPTFEFEEPSRLSFASLEPYLHRLLTTGLGMPEELLRTITRQPGVLLCSISTLSHLDPMTNKSKVAVLLTQSCEAVPDLGMSLAEGRAACGNRCPFAFWATLHAVLCPDSGLLWPALVDFIHDIPLLDDRSPLCSMQISDRHDDAANVTFLCKRFTLAGQHHTCLVLRCSHFTDYVVPGFHLRFPVRIRVTIPVPEQITVPPLVVDVDRLIDAFQTAFPVGTIDPSHMAMRRVGPQDHSDTKTSRFGPKAPAPAVPLAVPRPPAIKRSVTYSDAVTHSPNQTPSHADPVATSSTSIQSGIPIRAPHAPRPPPQHHRPNPRTSVTPPPPTTPPLWIQSQDVEIDHRLRQMPTALTDPPPIPECETIGTSEGTSERRPSVGFTLPPIGGDAPTTGATISSSSSFPLGPHGRPSVRLPPLPMRSVSQN